MRRLMGLPLAAPDRAPVSFDSTPDTQDSPLSPVSGAAPGGVASSGADRGASSGTVRDVVRSIITWHAEGPKPAASRQQTRDLSTSGSDSTGVDTGIDLRRLILDSELGGAVLRSVVDVNSEDKNGATFSIFGLGDFAVEFAPELHSAVISELSSGTVVRMTLSGERLGLEGYPALSIAENTPALPRQNINIVRLVWNWILDFLYSPVGALLTMTTGIILLFWIAVKSVFFLQRRVSRF